MLANFLNMLFQQLPTAKYIYQNILLQGLVTLATSIPQGHLRKQQKATGWRWKVRNLFAKVELSF